MKTKYEYEYITFVFVEKKSKTQVWQCNNTKSGNELGIIKWYAPWRQYCYFSNVAIYSIGCLDDIKDFIILLNLIRSK